MLGDLRLPTSLGSLAALSAASALLLSPSSLPLPTTLSPKLTPSPALPARGDTRFDPLRRSLHLNFLRTYQAKARL